MFRLKTLCLFRIDSREFISKCQNWVNYKKTSHSNVTLIISSDIFSLCESKKIEVLSKQWGWIVGVIERYFVDGMEVNRIMLVK